MLTSEQDAKTRWCPFVRLTDGGREYFDNRGDKFGGSSGKDGADASRCVGSACMAWCWSGEYKVTPDADGNPVENKLGWCGAAAKGEP